MAMIRGTAYWAKVFGEPQPGYDPSKTEWTIDVTVDAEARAVLEELGVADKINSPTHNKRGEPRNTPHASGQEYITFTRNGTKSDGSPAKHIRVVDRKKREWDPETLIGNGSEVAVKFVINEGEYRGKPWRKPGIIEIMVLNLEEYGEDEFDQFVDESDDFDDPEV